MSTVKEFSKVEEWPEVMDYKVMAKLLGMSPSKARVLMRKNGFPLLVFGPRMHRVRKGDLLKWLDSQVM